MWVLLCAVTLMCVLLIFLWWAGWDARRLLVQGMFGLCLCILLTDVFFFFGQSVPVAALFVETGDEVLRERLHVRIGCGRANFVEDFQGFHRAETRGAGPACIAFKQRLKAAVGILKLRKLGDGSVAAAVFEMVGETRALERTRRGADETYRAVERFFTQMLFSHAFNASVTSARNRGCEKQCDSDHANQTMNFSHASTSSMPRERDYAESRQVVLNVSDIAAGSIQPWEEVSLKCIG